MVAVEVEDIPMPESEGVIVTAPKTGPAKLGFDFPDGWILVIDTRETNALFKKPYKGMIVTRNTLKTGDYSVRGFEDKVCIERKSIQDLFVSLGSERSRFYDEIERMKTYESKVLLVEGKHEDCLCFKPYTKMHPNAVRASLMSIWVRHGIPIYFATNRHWAEVFVIDYLVKYYRIKREGK